VLVAMAIAQMAVAAAFKARVTEVIEAVDEPAHDLALLAELLDVIERQPVVSPGLKQLQTRIGSTGRTASAEIRALSRLVAMLSSRNNVMFAIPAGILMWATQWAFAIEAWRSRAGARIPEWLDVVGEFEALLALATFTAEHPDYAFPVFSDGPAGVTHLEIERAAHPTLGPGAVANSVSLEGTRDRHATGAAQAAGPALPALLVVSGSNMSGKSTLLRAIGANFVLAGMGAPVRAARMHVSPLTLGASIRVVDSLTDGRSRFMAEITRLKAIVDAAAARQGGLLFLLDEILSGTNSHDRRVGAEALLTTLVRTGAIGLITTHDLALGEIADRLPGAAANVHFEDQFVDGSLRFDYKLKPGVVQTSNALALMRSIGIDV
jgi:DNA mismatch repair ATPase MutS